jgi:hypothetical protein
MITSPNREEALTFAKRRFIEYKTVRNGINVISGPNLHERTEHILLDERLCHVVKMHLTNTAVESSFSIGSLKFILGLKTAKRFRSRSGEIFLV